MGSAAIQAFSSSLPSTWTGDGARFTSYRGRGGVCEAAGLCAASELAKKTRQQDEGNFIHRV
jgi:hypothetical protein